MKHFFYSLLFFLFFQNTLFSQALDTLVVVLESKMDNRVFYDQKKLERIEVLKANVSQHNNLEETYQIFNQIIDEYRFYSFDRALEYLEKNLQIAEQLNNNIFINDTKLKLSLLLVDSGRYKEAIDALNDIDRKSIPTSLLDVYYIAYKEGYSGLTYNTSVKSNKLIYSKFYTAYQDSLYTRLDPNLEESLRLKEKQFRDARKLNQALLINSKRLKGLEIGSRDFSLVSFERSLLHELLNDTAKQKEFLILSAISDIEASIKDNASMGTLAKILFEEGDIDRAHRYINFSFDDAKLYNSQLRFLDIANSLPMITKSYEEQSEKQKVKLENSLIFISVLAVFLLLTIYVVFKQIKKVSIARNNLKKVNEKLNASNEDLKRLYIELSESDKVKEHYIGTFLNLYSEYITKLDVYRKLVRKYVKANKMNTLLELSKSKQLIDEELEIFNKNFDNSFLHIYPNFISSVNHLLKPEEQIVIHTEGKLNTELRILALIKLGITNSSRIAKILRYSVNTIYNYRATIKSASLDKSTFENMIKKIK